MIEKDLLLSPATGDPTPASLLQLAISSGADIDKLEKLMGLQERWEQRQAKKAFFKALAKFQQICPVIRKNKTNSTPNYSYKSADLGQISQVIKKPLRDCGLTYRWEFFDGPRIKVSCLVTHEDGHTEITSIEADKDTSGGKNLIQASGSTITYLERYSLIGALGLSTADEDNDGKGAKPGGKQPAAAKDFKRKAAPAADSGEYPEYLQQWKDEVAKVKSRPELHTLYLKNKKTVDSDDKIKTIFKERQDQLPQTSKTTLP